MEDSLDIDDLFADDGALSLPQASISKGLIQKVDELRLLGCNQKIAWSKLGCVAALTADGRDVNLRVLCCDPEDGKWSLSRVYPVEQVANVHGGQQLLYLSWNHTGYELAVTDALGRISIFQMHVALNKLILKRSVKMDPEDDLGVVVGMTWLAHERPFPWYQQATRNGENFRFNITQYRMPGQLVQSIRAALICVTRNGVLRLLYQHPDHGWHETTTELESLSTSNDVLTHASFSSEQDNKLLLLVQSVSHHLRLYRIQIKWTPQGLQPAAQAAALPYPEMTVANMKILVPGFDDIQGSPDGGGASASQPQLSHMELLPLPPQMSSSEPIRLTVMAVFSHLAEVEASHYQESYSVIARWELQSVQSSLHSVFDQLNPGSKTAGSVELHDHHFKRLDDIIVDKIVLSVQLINSGLAIVFSYSDGTVEFRQRSDLAVMTRDDDANRVTNLLRTGFVLPVEEPFLHLSLSPNCCCAATMDDEGTIKLKMMRLTPEDEGTRVLARQENIVLALAMLYAQSLTHHNTGDDVLALVHQIETPNVERKLLSEIYRALSLSADYSTDQHNERTTTVPTIQKCLSVQDSLGRHGGQQHRSIAAKVAWMTLNLRYVFVNMFIITSTASKPGADVDLNRLGVDMLEYAISLMQWASDLVSYLADELLELASTVKGPTYTAEALNGAVATLGCPSLPVIVASVPRFFLRHMVRNVGVLATAARRGFLNSASDVERRKLFRDIVDRIEAGPVHIFQFDRFMRMVDASIRATYSSKSVSVAERGLIEKNMLISGEISEVLMAPGVQDIFQTHLMVLRNEISDPAKAHFADYSWLGLTDDRRAAKLLRENILDVMSKVVIPRPAARPSRRSALAQQQQQQQQQQQRHQNMNAIPAGYAAGVDGNASMNGIGGHYDGGSDAVASAQPLRLRQCTRCGSVMYDHPPSSSSSEVGASGVSRSNNVVGGGNTSMNGLGAGAGAGSSGGGGGGGNATSISMGAPAARGSSSGGPPPAGHSSSNNNSNNSSSNSAAARRASLLSPAKPWKIGVHKMCLCGSLWMQIVSDGRGGGNVGGGGGGGGGGGVGGDLYSG